MKEDFIDNFKLEVLNAGASVFGTTCIKNIKDKFNISKDEIKDLNYAISIGFRLSSKILDSIKDHPTKIYFHHYKMVNMFLDQLALKITAILQNENNLAFPIPASQIVEWKSQTAHLSHKEVAYLAGLGWIGRNNLLVTPEYGAQVRFVTILTDLKLPQGETMDFNCGDCFDCIETCPAQAIKELPSEFDHISCYNKLDEFKKKNFVGQHICGICVRSCRKKV
ncbi:MAG: hypothetical protein P9M06_05515 [Candidatus Saelkia tenebricola]|nr:hypothetical protein [Candidatus Saelkia tenebricola]